MRNPRKRQKAPKRPLRNRKRRRRLLLVYRYVDAFVQERLKRNLFNTAPSPFAAIGIQWE